MLQPIANAPENIVAYQATGEVTKEDFDRVMREADEKIAKYDELNYLLKLDTPIKNFTFSAWMNDAWFGIKNLTKWNRCAIVTDKESIQKFTEIFSKVMVGEFRGYDPEKLQEAMEWVSKGA